MKILHLIEKNTWVIFMILGDTVGQREKHSFVFFIFKHHTPKALKVGELSHSKPTGGSIAAVKQKSRGARRGGKFIQIVLVQ